MNLRRAFFAVGLSLFWIRYEPLPNRKEASSRPGTSLIPSAQSLILAAAQLHFLHFKKRKMKRKEERKNEKEKVTKRIK